VIAEDAGDEVGLDDDELLGAVGLEVSEALDVDGAADVVDAGAGELARE